MDPTVFKLRFVYNKNVVGLKKTYFKNQENDYAGQAQNRILPPVRLKCIVGQLQCIVGRLKCIVGRLKCIVGRLKCIVGRLKCIVGRLKCIVGRLKDFKILQEQFH
jgi:hypothetical protein